MQQNINRTTTSTASINKSTISGSFVSSPNDKNDSQFQRAIKYLNEPFSNDEKKMFKVMFGITFVVIISHILPINLLLKILIKIIVILFCAAIILTIWLYCFVETEHRIDFINRFVDIVKLTVDKFQNDFLNVAGDDAIKKGEETSYKFEFLTQK